MQNQEQPHNDTPGLCRLSAAARRAGLTAEKFEEASTAGLIPVAVIRLSPRMAYVKCIELENWLKGNSHE